MKIAILAHTLHPICEPYQGGLEMITYLLCKALLQKGHIVDLYAHKDSSNEFNVIPFDYRLRNGVVPLTYLSLEAKFALEGHLDKIAYANALTVITNNDYDIVHNHSLHYLPMLAGNFTTLPLITTIHTPAFPYLQLGAQYLYPNSSHRFAMVSASLQSEWNSRLKGSTVIYNGIDISKWAFNSHPEGDYLFWYGRICKEKGTHLAIQMALKANQKLILAGPISNQAYYEMSVEPLLVNSNVTYVGHLEQSDIHSYLSNAKAFLFTSVWSEPYGLTIAESLSCGTPVVAFDSGAAQEIITDNCGIIVPIGSVYKFIKAIHRVRHLHRNDCRERAVAFCSHDKMVDSYETLYCEIQCESQQHERIVS